MKYVTLTSYTGAQRLTASKELELSTKSNPLQTEPPSAQRLTASKELERFWNHVWGFRTFAECSTPYGIKGIGT